MPRGGKRPGAGRKSLKDEEKMMNFKRSFALVLHGLISKEELAAIIADECRKRNIKAIGYAYDILKEGLSNDNEKNNININQVIIERKIIDTSVEN